MVWPYNLKRLFSRSGVGVVKVERSHVITTSSPSSENRKRWQGIGLAGSLRALRWRRFTSPCLPLYQSHVGKFTRRYSSSSFTSFIQADGDQGLSARARVLATCATCSSPSTAASTCLGRTAGSTPDGSCQTGSTFRQTGTGSSVAFLCG
jgi:hypothetical protein